MQSIIAKAALTVVSSGICLSGRGAFGIVSSVATGEQRHFTITLKDLGIPSLKL
jgi:hypothetical protein